MGETRPPQGAQLGRVAFALPISLDLTGRRAVVVGGADHGDFAFPAVVRRGDLRVAVSTGGKAPALARWVGRKLYRTIGPEYGDLVDVVRTVREDVRLVRSGRIVGAGPGDGGLLPLRARQLLDEADVVVFDRLLSPDLVEGKRSIYVGKEPGKERARKRVVRLTGGDPFVFGRGAEEAEALAAEGIGAGLRPSSS